MPETPSSTALLRASWNRVWNGPDYVRIPAARRWFLIEGILALVVAIAIDQFTDVPYVMTPLYAIPVLVIAHSEEPRIVALMGVMATVVNLLSAIGDGTPAEVSAFYSIGLVLTAYLAVVFSIQKREAERRAYEAREARENLETVVSMIAHDLSGSLTPLIAFSELMQVKALPPDDQRHALASINSAAYRVNRLARDLSATSSMLANRFQIHPVAMDLVEITREVIRLLEAALPQRAILLDAPARVDGTWDRDRIAQVLTNLISNAVKYSPAETAVQVNITTDGQSVRVRVCDHGIGLTREEQGRLFRPFSRIAHDDAVGGVGLGLHIARGIAEAHGGTITVESETGAGSTFTLSLPNAAGLSAGPAPSRVLSSVRSES